MLFNVGHRMEFCSLDAYCDGYVGPRALQDWEQGRRRPDRATGAYLTVIARHPEAVVEALAS